MGNLKLIRSQLAFGRDKKALGGQPFCFLVVWQDDDGRWLDSHFVCSEKFNRTSLNSKMKIFYIELSTYVLPRSYYDTVNPGKKASQEQSRKKEFQGSLL